MGMLSREPDLEAEQGEQLPAETPSRSKPSFLCRRLPEPERPALNPPRLVVPDQERLTPLIAEHARRLKLATISTLASMVRDWPFKRQTLHPRPCFVGIGPYRCSHASFAGHPAHERPGGSDNGKTAGFRLTKAALRGGAHMRVA
jgi:hypothetical protein